MAAVFALPRSAAAPDALHAIVGQCRMCGGAVTLPSVRRAGSRAVPSCGTCGTVARASLMVAA